MTSNVATIVARVAFFASDVVVDSRPDSSTASTFAETYGSLAHTSLTHTPTVLSLPHGADPGSTLARRASSGLVSYTATPTTPLLARIVPHLAILAHHAVVIHLAVRDDLGPALLLRSSAPFFIYSDSAQQAHDHALLASRLAKAEGKLVVHAFREYSSHEDSVEVVTGDEIQPFVHAQSSPNKPNGAANGYANGHANGHTNGHANGHVNGHVNGHAPEPGVTADLLHAYDAAAAATIKLVRRAQPTFDHYGSKEATATVIAFGHLGPSILPEEVALISLSLISPFPASRILSGSLHHSTRQLLVLEQIKKWSTKWTPLYLDVISAMQERGLISHISARSASLGDLSNVVPKQVRAFIAEVFSNPGGKRHVLGSNDAPKYNGAPTAQVPKHEASYTKILEELFGGRLDIANSTRKIESHGTAATSPEFALGRIRGDEQERNSLVNAVQELLDDSSVPAEVHSLLSKWMIAKGEKTKSQSVAEDLVRALEEAKLSHPAAARILAGRHNLSVSSRWIVGSDAWSYDLGASGLHHVIASGLNVNVLLLDTVPYSARTTTDPARRKQDAGLYAMNHGDVYVASVAVYASYGQVLQALSEADAYPGPSVVLAYLPYANESSSALDVLKETKLAVDAGYWPLYRWNPAKDVDGSEPFALDSDAIKAELRTFLDRHNHLSLLERSTPAVASEIVSNLGDDVRDARKRRAKKIYDELVTAIDAPPLTVLYASDGGKAEKVAKRLAARGKARGLSTTISTLDGVPLDSLSQEEFVVFVVSVAGQGEFPQNGRTAVKSYNQAAARNETPLTKLKYSVFGMGDSHYWPRPEDAHYYNKAGKDLDARLTSLGGERFAQLGLGDDQDPDGPETGYKAWEPLVWKALGVDTVEVTEAEPEPITNEHIKAASNYLRGTIPEGLEDATTGALSPSDGQLTKFHGIYQQDDRDIRDERQAQGVEPAFSFMIRVRLPGGVCRPDQWLAIDNIADEHGNGTFKITTRSTFQFHGVIKRHLKPAIQDINRALMDTLAACGDVNRNVLVSAIPTLSRLHAQVHNFAVEVSEHLLPRTTAYHEIWLDKKMVAGEALRDVEPLYGEFYLPRKFKIAVAVPPTNDVDVFANDVGFIAIVNARGELDGFDVAIGGGMGVTHGNKKTYPRTADVIGFCTPEQGKYVAEKIMLVQRDHGNRVDRKNARLKYTIDRLGLDVFKSEVEKLLGYKLAPARPYTFDRNLDDYGWHKGENGNHHVMLYIENGRVQDEPGKDFKTGLREIAKIHQGTFRLTANQHIMITDIPEEEVPRIKGLLAKYKLDNLNFTGLRLSSSACVAFPTCGLAMAESERYLPLLIDKVEKICEENGLRNDSIVMRMTGCPNGCARPYIAEVAFVGKAPGTYLMLLGGGYYGQRLNKIYRESVTEPEILAILKPMIKRYALERLSGEHFGDFVIRAGYIAPTTEGKAWYDRSGGEGEHRLVAS